MGESREGRGIRNSHPSHTLQWLPLFLNSSLSRLSLTVLLSLSWPLVLFPSSLSSATRRTLRILYVFRDTFSFTVTHVRCRAPPTPPTSPTGTPMRRRLPSSSSVSFTHALPFKDRFLPAASLPTEDRQPGLLADPAKPNLLTADAKLTHLSPYLGTEIRGVQISQLTKEGLNELALYAAERKVLIFRDQDFKDLSPEKQIEIAS